MKKGKYDEVTSELEAKGKIEVSSTSEVTEVKSKLKTKRIIRPRAKYREVVYLGTADQSTVKGIVTNKKYIFKKDMYRMPIPTKVDERDYPGILALKGKGCVRRNPTALFMSKLDWDLEIERARISNR